MCPRLEQGRGVRDDIATGRVEEQPLAGHLGDQAILAEGGERVDRAARRGHPEGRAWRDEVPQTIARQRVQGDDGPPVPEEEEPTADEERIAQRRGARLLDDAIGTPRFEERPDARDAMLPHARTGGRLDREGRPRIADEQERAVESSPRLP